MAKDEVDTVEEGAVGNVHAEAWAERQRDPARYEDPTVSTPGVLEDIEGDAGPQALVDPEGDDPAKDHPLDPSVDNRTEVQPMLDTLHADALEHNEAQGARTPDALSKDAGSKSNKASQTERAAAAKEASAEAAKERSDAPKSDVKK